MPNNKVLSTTTSTGTGTTYKWFYFGLAVRSRRKQSRSRSSCVCLDLLASLEGHRENTDSSMSSQALGCMSSVRLMRRTSSGTGSATQECS